MTVALRDAPISCRCGCRARRCSHHSRPGPCHTVGYVGTGPSRLRAAAVAATNDNVDRLGACVDVRRSTADNDNVAAADNRAATSTTADWHGARSCARTTCCDGRSAVAAERLRLHRLERVRLAIEALESNEQQRHVGPRSVSNQRRAQPTVACARSRSVRARACGHLCVAALSTRYSVRSMDGCRQVRCVTEK